MAIIDRNHEKLTDLKIGTKNIDLGGLLTEAHEIDDKWEDHFVKAKKVSPVILTENAQQRFKVGRSNVDLDMTEMAFGQACTRVGVPAAFVRKCYDTGHNDLAVRIFKEFGNAPVDKDTKMRVRVFDNVVHANLSSSWNEFSNARIMDAVYDAVGSNSRYEPNQAYLSPDRIHIRFVDFNNPLKVAGDELYSGFTVSSSDIGNGAFSVVYFLYRFACRNGIVRVSQRGVLFKQSHKQEFVIDGHALFSKAMTTMQDLDRDAEYMISRAMGKKLDTELLNLYLEKAKRELHLGKKGYEDFRELLDTTYDPTLWGFVNAVTESAQDYSLEDRVFMESWAGNILSSAA